MNINLTPDGPSAEQTGSEALDVLLERLRATLSGAGVPVNDMLLPGLDRAEATSLLHAAGLGAPEEVLTWFEWANGWRSPADGASSAAPIPYLENASLQDALRLYEDVILPLGREGTPGYDPALGVGEGWLPLSHDNWGRYVHCNDQSSQAPLVRRANPEAWDPATHALFRGRSLCTLVSWAITSIDEGAAMWRPGDQQWSIDASKLPPLQVKSGL
ncbi:MULTISPECIES: hypothetical protein [unclassified Leifsonia]|uniref:hypothetical protein n=1 Tax=unclassified Leifsonia TaxID=2663824 RepID=UPI001113FFFF|nr:MULTISPECIES: hypothetical protein [unclassified Leifsonia]